MTLHSLWRRLWLGRARIEAEARREAGEEQSPAGPLIAHLCVDARFFHPETRWMIAYLPFFRAFTLAGMAMLRETSGPGASPVETQAQLHVQALLLENLRAAGLLVGASAPPGMN